jgi:hypothetical protein
MERRGGPAGPPHCFWARWHDSDCSPYLSAARKPYKIFTVRDAFARANCGNLHPGTKTIDIQADQLAVFQNGDLWLSQIE